MAPGPKSKQRGPDETRKTRYENAFDKPLGQNVFFEKNPRIADTVLLQEGGWGGKKEGVRSGLRKKTAEQQYKACGPF